MGIDVGSVSASAAVVDGAGDLLAWASRPHGGRPEKVLGEVLADLGAGADVLRAATASTARGVSAALRVNDVVAAVRAAERLHPGLGALLVVGGERFSLTLFREDGRYLYTRYNTLCAAGTGSFLDQQARRLGLADAAELARRALENQAEPPRIATRCAVFAKTDLIHAQQEGHALPAICDGLCRGLAANLHDTLFAGEEARAPVVFAGGVALNRATRRHLEALCGLAFTVDETAQVYCAYGAALSLLDATRGQERAVDIEDVVAAEPAPAAARAYFPPLEALKGRYPDFSAHRSYVFSPRQVALPEPVEVDDYRPTSGKLTAFLGMDIGSTSTKAVLLGEGQEAEPPVLAGFYTRTAGRPLEAVQGIFEAAHDWATRCGAELEVRGAGTTGSGRKFIGSLVRADLVLDEITAHARAAVELDPSVDTIIEIGGQDAKFTSLSRGVVTQSIMNHVCAAGTGSFIEEQARRLGCPLAEMAGRTEGRRSPLASDRCTVFMERDLNQFLAEGYEPNEVLCAVLHAVRDNYLLKVAREGHIGRQVWFQGATAKNRSLVAAFEQKLERPVHVSRYCHLTGALGVALELQSLAAAGKLGPSAFRGLSLYRERIPVRGEVCTLCHNNCKLRLAEINGQTVGFGYLCGREPSEQRFVSANRSGFDLLEARRKHFAFEPRPGPEKILVGLPAALHLVEDLPLWRRFFDELGLRVLTSQALSEPVARGKKLTGAEFCAPISAWHAHVAWLLERCDFVFAPFYLEAEHPPEDRRQFCYYTQYAPALAGQAVGNKARAKLLQPLIHVGQRKFNSYARLHAALQPVLQGRLGRDGVVRAWETASAWFEERRAALPEVMQQALGAKDDVAVVLLGRPYTVLSPAMNAGIPGIFGRLGVKAFSQDMLPQQEPAELRALLRASKWFQSRRIFAAADAVGRTDGLYPVLLTSFKCTPDACTMEYIRRILDAHQKPYLVLQLDEHDSRVGYETRIEAALRAFRNHRQGSRPRTDQAQLSRVPVRIKRAGGRTVFVPPWDTLGTRLFTAVLRRTGADARLIPETPTLIRESLGHNTGQCLPLSIIVHEFIRAVRQANLDPAQTALWMPTSSIGCNICFFPQYGKALLESIGGGFEKAAIYAGEPSCQEISARAILHSFYAFTFAGMLRRMICRVRPYEKHPGETDRAAAWAMDLFERTLLEDLPRRRAVRQVVDAFLQIGVEREPRPLVAIFGDLYCRDNDVFNQELVRLIERHGGEALCTPYTEYTRIIAGPYLRKWWREGLYRDVLLTAPFAMGFELLEYPFRREFQRVLGRRPVVRRRDRPEKILSRFGVSMFHTGESFDNLLKIFHLVERYPEISLFVQTNPAFCCPSLVTEAMANRIERETGVPVVTVTYDGTSADHNQRVVPYLELAVGKAGGVGRAANLPAQASEAPRPVA
ncbi:MAG: CoA activase [Myxococcales bacterium]|nr:CoA activase [Myxococcales bacterium]